jgi:hypothetical protein
MESLSGGGVADAEIDTPSGLDEADRRQIAERLRWTPKERLDYLLDMLVFEERAHRARPMKPKP